MERGLASVRSKADWLSAAGILLLVGPVALFDSTFELAAWLALVPTFGILLVTAAGHRSWINRTLLSHPLLMSLVLVAYPLYLWRGPMLAAIGADTSELPDASLRSLIVALSFLLAWFTWRFSEAPVRFTMASCRRVLPCLVTMFGIFFVNVAATSNVIPRSVDRVGEPSAPAGLEQMLSTVAEPGHSTRLTRLVVVPHSTFYMDSVNPETTLFIGDASLDRYSSRVIRLLSQRLGRPRSVVFVTAAGCAPIRHVILKTSSCDEARDFALTMIDRPEITKVVIGGCWDCWFNRQSDDYFVVKDGRSVLLRTPEGARAALESLQRQLASISTPPSKKTIQLLLDDAHGADEAELRQQIVDLAEHLAIDVIAPADMFGEPRPGLPAQFH